MTRPFKLAIVRARSDDSTYIPDDACREMLMSGPFSVLRFWEETTNGWLDFVDSTMFPWVDVTVPPSSTDRGTLARLAFEALRAANPGFDPLSGFSGALVLMLPGRGMVTNPKAGQPGEAPTILADFDAGSSDIDGFSFSVISSQTSDHTFMCHELGHTLGFHHTFGLDNNGIDYDADDDVVELSPEYGSPFDLMSSAAFGSRWLGTGPKYDANPTFLGPLVSGWPDAGATAMGPGMSRANLHRWFAEALASQTTERPFPAAGEVVRVRLAHAESPSGYTLLILHPPDEAADGVGRVYVEYRTADGWDRGLGSADAGLAQPGVVVHTLDEAPGVGPRAWYRGSITNDGADTDVALTGRPLVVSVELHDEQDGHKYAQIAVRTAVDQTARVTVDSSDQVVDDTGTEARRTPCGDTITYGTWLTSTIAQFGLLTTGFDGGVEPLGVRWQAGGTALSVSGLVQITTTDGRVVTVTAFLDAALGTLTVTSQGGDAYTATIIATVTDGAHSMTATGSFVATGSFTGYRNEDVSILGSCIARQAHELVEVGAGHVGVLDHEAIHALLDHHEVWGAGEIEQWQQHAQTTIDSINQVDPGIAAQLTELVELHGPG